MGFADNYFSKNQNFIQHIEEPPKGLLRFVTVIPAYLEDGIFSTLQSIENAVLPEGYFEIIIVVNFSESDSVENKRINNEIFSKLVEWSGIHSSGDLTFYPLLAADLPKKHAGVGLARKIGMDEALRRFDCINNPEGLILSLDADSLIDPDYFQAITRSMSANTKCGGCLLYFEHTLEGNEFEDTVYQAVMHYELHLRYYKHILKYIGFPYAKYTIGSCFGVKAGFYAQQGGMNRRQAGEDFYFLNKLFPNREFVEIAYTCIHPSPRPSLRVPFGTGVSISKMISQQDFMFETYSPFAFFDLKDFLSDLKKIYYCNHEQLINEFDRWPAPVRDFLLQNHFLEKYEEIKSNSGSIDAFIKRFYKWFDGFKVVKYLNLAHEKLYKKLPVEKAVVEFLLRTEYIGEEKKITDYLELFRRLDRKGLFIT